MLGERATDGVDLLRMRASSTPERQALVASDTAEGWTFREFDDAVDVTARALQAHLDSASDDHRIGIALTTSPAFVVVIHAAFRIGATVIPLNTALPASELATQIDRCSPEICLCDRTTTATTATAIQQTSQPTPALLSVEEPAAAEIEPLLARTAPIKSSPHRLQDTALILFTSGTTGEPKGVRLTLGNLLWSAIASALRLGVSPSDRWLCCLPMYHMGGLAPAIRTVCYGTTLVLQPEFDAEETAGVLSDQKITGISLVPTQLQRLLDAGLDGSTLQTVLLGGAPATESVLERAMEADVPLYPTYGLTETASQVATATPDQVANYPETVGQPLLGTSVRIVADGEEVPPGERGELVIDGPTVTPGYLDDARTAAAFDSFGLRTGDIGYRDEDGRLWVIGRNDEMILTGGELVAPEEVAEVIRAVDGVEAVAVIGLADQEWGERVAAVVVPSSNTDSTAAVRAKIDNHCGEELASYKQPKTIDFVDALPRTHSGTLDRDAVRDLLEEPQ